MLSDCETVLDEGDGAREARDAHVEKLPPSDRDDVDNAEGLLTRIPNLRLLDLTRYVFSQNFRVNSLKLPSWGQRSSVHR